MTVLSREAEDVSSSVLTILALNPPNEATCVTVQAVTAAIRYTLDGTTPTASLGFRLIPGKRPREILIDDFRQIKFMRESSDAVLQVSYHAGRDVTAFHDEPPPEEDLGQDTRVGWGTEDGKTIEWIDGS